MAILKYILPLLAASLLTSCYENFNPEVESKPVLCLNSLITAGEPIEVQVTHTWRYNDKAGEQNHEVDDATITLKVNGQTVDEDYIPQEGDVVTIAAESRLYGSATATVTVPFATPIGKVKMTPRATDVWINEEVSEYFDSYLYLSFNLGIELDVEDAADRDNFYNFTFYRYDGLTPGPPKFNLGNFEYDAEPIFKEHIGVFESIMGSDGISNFIFTDRQFSGKTYTLHLNFFDNTFTLPSNFYDDSMLDCGITLRLISVSRSFYNHAVYKWNIDEGMIGEMSQVGLAETIWGYSNVSSGAGIVAAQSISECTLSLHDFLKETLEEIDFSSAPSSD